MKILFVTAAPLEYSSSANMRNVALINGLIKLGHEVSTFSADIEENSKYIDSTLVNIKLKKRYWIANTKFHTKISSKNVEENNLKSKIKKVIIKNTYNIYSKFRIYDSRKSLLKKIDKNIVDEEFDLIISSSDPKSSHLIAKKLINEKPNITKKWIQYWGDPFADDINKNTYIPKFLIKKEEKRILNLADKIIYVSPFTLDTQKNIYKEYKEKMEFLPIPYQNEIYYKKTDNKCPILGYYGDYNEKDRNILPLYKVAQNMKVALNICGNSNIILDSKDNIFIKPRQKMSIIRQEEEKTDLLICICNKKGTQIPGKVYHYAATNKPILIIVDGENSNNLKEYFQKFNRYLLCENNEEDIRRAINEWLNKGEEQFLPCEYFKPEIIAKQFIRIEKN